MELLETILRDAGQIMESGSCSGEPSRGFARTMGGMDWQRGEERRHRGEVGRNSSPAQLYTNIMVLLKDTGNSILVFQHTERPPCLHGVVLSVFSCSMFSPGPCLWNMLHTGIYIPLDMWCPGHTLSFTHSIHMYLALLCSRHCWVLGVQR